MPVSAEDNSILLCVRCCERGLVLDKKKKKKTNTKKGKTVRRVRKAEKKRKIIWIRKIKEIPCKGRRKIEPNKDIQYCYFA